jgi:hemolysin activation/secretion protein
LRLTIEEPEMFQVGLTADNYSSSSVGSERVRANVGVRNATGFGETFNFSGALSQGATDISASIGAPITASNTRVRLFYGRSDSKVIESQVRALDIKSLTDTVGFDVEQPIIDRVDSTLALNLGFERRHSETSVLGVPFSFSPGAQDGVSNTSVVLAGASWSRRKNDSLFSVRGTYRRGIDAFGATVFKPRTEFDALLNPTGTDGRFSMFVGQVLYLYRLNQVGFLSKLSDRAELQMRTTAQVSLDPLMSLEKFGVGGANCVRGYAENLLVRDSGVCATVELQLPIAGYHAEPHPLNLVVAPFIDYGRSQDKVDIDLISDVRDTDTARWIVGAGVGLLWQPLRGIRAQVYWGQALADNFAGDDPRDNTSNEQRKDLQADGVHFFVSYQYDF